MFCGFTARILFRNDVEKALILTLILEPIALLISAGLREAYHRLDLRSGFTFRTLAATAFLSALAASLEVVCSLAVDYSFSWTLVNNYPHRGVPLRWVFYWFVFGGWSAAYLWLKAEFRMRSEQELLKEAEAAAQRSELQMLRLQLNPHFMFNSLNNIASEIPERPDVALEMTHRLAEYLRYTLDQRDEMIVLLSDEVKAVTTYLEIEQQRFGNRLRVSVEAEPATGAAPVPCFLLQPLVENAVKHGLNSSAPPWELSVKVSHEQERLCIEVRNTGRLAQEWNSKEKPGVGLLNLRRRLELHFPSRHRFNLHEQEGWVCSQILLEGVPCRL